ncbi:DnaA N-terminal domain-containing protein, partial [Sphingomonas sp.]|uniref:DnaA N-terminal domain-containing protein n=1 Tax=Sphingomonas sp. TaxID=28214 RepID=UPI002BB452FE
MAVGRDGLDDAVAKAWNRVRTNLRHSAGQRLFDQWLKPAVLIDGSDSESVRLGFPTAFMTTWVKSHYADRLFYEFRAILPDVRSVSIETLSDARPQRVLTVDSPAPADLPERAPAKRGQTHSFDARFTFDRFVIDTSNRVAFNAARLLAEPGTPR